MHELKTGAQKALDEYQRISPEQIQFGTMWKGSGYRMSGDNALDWALIAPAPTCIVHFSEDGHDKDSYVFKIDGTSGLTKGRVNGIDGTVRVSLPPNSDPSDPKNLKIRGSEEY